MAAGSGRQRRTKISPEDVERAARSRERRQGDEPLDAAALYRAHAPAVLGYLRARRAADAEDLLGEVFLQVSRDLPRYDGRQADLRRWVFTIARNRLIDRHRAVERRPEVVVGVPDRSDERAVPPDPVDPALVAALSQLSDAQREVLLLRYVADLSLEDVALVTDRSVGAVKALQHRALGQLRSRLATEAVEPAVPRADAPAAPV